jgi:hypothetical protein
MTCPLAAPAPETPREVYLLCIGAGKARNPAAAMALQRRLTRAAIPHAGSAATFAAQ